LEVAVRVGVNVASEVSVKASVVAAVTADGVGVAGSSVEGAQAAASRKINKMILWTLILILLTQCSATPGCRATQM
jgi:hypothetical protein